VLWTANHKLFSHRACSAYTNCGKDRVTNNQCLSFLCIGLCRTHLAARQVGSVLMLTQERRKMFLLFLFVSSFLVRNFYFIIS